MARPVCLFLVFAACSGDPAAALTSAPPPAPAPVAAAKPPPPDLSLGAGFEMRHPVHDGHLTVIPIVATEDPPAVHYVTLADALAHHRATVRELPDWQVDQVRIRNRSRQPLFAMEGELILGALQDRVLAESIVVPPGGSEIVHVRCVEQQREEGGRFFHSPQLVAELALRRLITHGTQQQVWNEVDAINARANLNPPTHTYRLAAQLQNGGAVAATRDRLAAQLASAPDRDRIVGLAVAIDGDVIGIDRFATPELYRAYESEMLGAYSATAERTPPHEGRTLLPADVRVLATTPGADVTEAAFIALRPPT